MSRRIPDTQADDGDDAVQWSEVIAAWRTPLRVVAGGGLVVALVVIVLRTLSERSDNPDAYLGGLFFTAVALSVAIGIAIVTAADD